MGVILAGKQLNSWLRDRQTALGWLKLAWGGDDIWKIEQPWA